ncbi:MAG: hypothetical protein WCX13_02775 [Candidatus Hydrogenedentales bacterium]
MNLLPFHLGLMATATAAMLAAVVVARFFRKKKWWLKAHKSLNLAAVGLALSGFVLAFIMVQSSGGPHIRVSHAVFGGVALLFLIAMPCLGFMIFKSKDREKTARLRIAHRWLGRLAAILCCAAAVAGLFLIGVL